MTEHTFCVVQPLEYRDYVPVTYCSEEHPVVFQHPKTKILWSPLRLNNQVACLICIANVVGLQCARSHMAFDVVGK